MKARIRDDEVLLKEETEELFTNYTIDLVDWCTCRTISTVLTVLKDKHFFSSELLNQIMQEYVDMQDDDRFTKKFDEFMKNSEDLDISPCDYYDKYLKEDLGIDMDKIRASFYGYDDEESE